MGKARIQSLGHHVYDQGVSRAHDLHGHLPAALRGGELSEFWVFDDSRIDPDGADASSWEVSHEPVRFVGTFPKDPGVVWVVWLTGVLALDLLWYSNGPVWTLVCK